MKIRLVIDVVVQTLLWVILAVQLVQAPEQLIYHLSIFAGLLTAWQLLHAWYVVQKYEDWQRKQHLRQAKKIAAYIGLTLGIGALMVLATAGVLWTFWLFVLESVYVLWAIVGSLLAIWYFGLSWKKLVEAYFSPKSFWDL